MFPLVTIMVTHFEPNADATLATLDSVLQQKVPVKPSVLVIDNGTVDRAGSGSKVRNRCFGVGCNVMYQRARAERTWGSLVRYYDVMVMTRYLMLLNQGDVLGDKDTLAGLVDAAEGFAGRSGGPSKCSGAILAENPSVKLLRLYYYNMAGGVEVAQPGLEMTRLVRKMEQLAPFAFLGEMPEEPKTEEVATSA